MSRFLLLALLAKMNPERLARGCLKGMSGRAGPEVILTGRGVSGKGARPVLMVD